MRHGLKTAWILGLTAIAMACSSDEKKASSSPAAAAAPTAATGPTGQGPNKEPVETAAKTPEARPTPPPPVGEPTAESPPAPPPPAPPPPAPVTELGPTADGATYQMPKAQLDKAYLISIALNDGPPFGVGVSVPAFIGHFELLGSDLFLVENVDAYQVASKTLPTERLLAKFAVRSTSDDAIVFDFLGGVDQLLMRSEVAGDAVIDVMSSLVRKSFVKDGALFVEQTIQIRQAENTASDPVNDGALFSRVKYTFVPYAPASGFAVRDFSPKVGFFTADVYDLATGQKRKLAERWRRSAPIKYSLAGVPDGFKNAVRDGVLYWEKAIGENFVAVEDAPEGVGPNEPGVNVIQWVNSLEMTYAYADWVADPTTGEIVQAQIYLPSFWAIGTRREAIAFVAEAGAGHSAVRPHRESRDSALCFHDQNDKYVSAMRALLADPAVDDAAIARFSSDVLTATVAHEVGHTLGLRHNFAGSLGAHEDALADSAFHSYLETGEVPETAVTSSSIMDYNPDRFDAMMGAKMRLKRSTLLAYDAKAIAWGYSDDAEHLDEDVGVFCTDESANGAILDCLRFDAPGLPLASAFRDFVTSKNAAGSDLANRFLEALDPTGGGPRHEVTEVPLRPGSNGARDASSLERLLAMLRPDARLLAIESQLPFHTEFNDDDYVEMLTSYQRGWLSDQEGGFASILGAVVPHAGASDEMAMTPWAVDAQAVFAAQVTSESFRSGTDAAGEPYRFSDEDVAYMQGAGERYFVIYDEALVAGAVSALSTSRFADVDASADQRTIAASMAAALADLATAVILAGDGGSIQKVVENHSIDTPTPRYGIETRLAAAALLAPDRFALPFPVDFSKTTRDDLIAVLSDRMDEINFHGVIADEDLPESVRILVIELRVLIGALSNQGL